MKAIIETGGKQYSVEEGSIIYVEKLDVEEGKEVVFDKVLMANGVIGIGYGNAKQFLSRLNNYGVTREEFVEAVKSIDTGEEK